MNTQPVTSKSKLLKKLDVFAIVVSIAVLALVVMMREITIQVDVDLSFLPAFHAIINSLAAFFLLLGLIAIKSKKVEIHKRMIMTAMVLSIIFLLSYVVYHITSETTVYCKTGSIRYVYFTLLISHIILAALILPFILFTFNRAWTGFFDRHKAMARWVFPIWFYVACTGPICYLMLRPCY